jgi:DNA-3-methyladenine glycosylase II
MYGWRMRHVRVKTSKVEKLARQRRSVKARVSSKPAAKQSTAKVQTTATAKTVARAAPAKVLRAKTLARIITEDADVISGTLALRKVCKHMRKAHDLAGHPPLRRRAAGFEGLARIVVAQQVSVASANAIWARFEAVAQPMTAGTVILLSDDALRSAGLSRPKIKTLRAVSDAVVRGLDLENLDSLSDADVHAALTAVSGIGPWTADIFLLFNLGRADAFAHGDLALQVAVQMLMDLDERPKANELLAIAERWRPWRGVAARLLWAYYAAAKVQKGGGVAV